jgi:flagellar P-ring protein precursor FlgI
MPRILAISVLLISLALEGVGAPVRLKELVALEGVRDNQLMGLGLVVGLAGTGDRRQTVFSAQSLTNLLERMGLDVPATAIQVKNVALVTVTATLPPFAQPGSRIDATVAAIGDASSLQGGILLMTGVKGPDGQVYAVAQGPAIVGGFVAGGSGNSQTVNHPTVGRLPDGAIVERPSPPAKITGDLRLQLRQADFTTATRITEALNKRFGAVAHTENAALVIVGPPPEFQKNPAEFIAEIERLTVEPDRAQRIVVNERTGTIVMGKEVRIAPMAVMQGSLTVEIQTTINVSQPNALGTGTTQATPQVSLGVKETPAHNISLKEGSTVEELVRALSAIGSTPRDIIAILQSLKSAGALGAELEVI